MSLVLPNFATADDLVDRVFVRDRPAQLWLTDISEDPTLEGKGHTDVPAKLGPAHRP